MDPEAIDRVAAIFAMLADATRLRIVLALASGGMQVNVLAAALGREKSLVSKHLGILRHAGVVDARRRGQFVTYALRDGLPSALVALALSKQP